MYIIGTLREKEKLTKKVFKLTFELSRKLTKPYPGRYIMMWLPGSGEIPLSLYKVEGNRASFLIEVVGKTTRDICNLELGKNVGIRGPYGRGFNLSRSSYLLIAGGIGAPPILYASREIGRLKKRAIYLFGARTAEDLFLLNEPEEYGLKVFHSTDDGSSGFKGYVTQLAEKFIKNDEFEAILACGPDPMIKAALELANKYGLYFEASMTRIVKCGVGLCGICELKPKGLLVCRDGPVFNGDALKGVHFKG